LLSEVLDCAGNGLNYILGVAPTTTLRRHIEGLEASTKARLRLRPGWQAPPLQGEFRRRQAGAGERIIARVRSRAEGPDTRFIVTI